MSLDDVSHPAFGVAGIGAIDIPKQRLRAMYDLPRVGPDEPGWQEQLAQQQRERISSKVARFGERNVVARGKGRS
ncbi:hypothetical protein [Microcoleus sp. Pol10D4]|uniref:hypothetical protein n=1 Tax=Microcoleus sp. Pol10D4 TaxID=3055387 RepID=UPI002FD4EF30